MTDGQQPRDAIDGRPEVVTVPLVGGSRVDRHPHADPVDRREVFDC